MRKIHTIIVCFLFTTCFNTFSQTIPLQTDEVIGKIIRFDVSNFTQTFLNTSEGSRIGSKFETSFPMPDGSNKTFIIDESFISTIPIESIKTFDGTADKGKIKMKLTISSENRMTGIMHTPEGYFYIEPIEGKDNEFLIYSLAEAPMHKFKCGTLDHEIFEMLDNKKSKKSSVAPFPVGTHLRTYRMAAAATGEFVTFYGSKANALAKIVEVMNASNLIYELEASIRFQLIPATSNHTILFDNAATDPFTPNTSFASATESQNGFNSMHSSGLLNYSSYDMGHTFNIYAPSSNTSYSSQGQAGPSPCDNPLKARGWTEWSSNALDFSGGLSLVVGVFVHEVGHQFYAPHSHNAIGGSAASPTFCTGGWSSTSAVEPGSGSTLMGYGGNCSYPTNYVLNGNNNLNYFHSKSLEFIYTTVNTYASCATSSLNGNSSPIANAGLDISIPKGTPFKLTGSASDIEGDALSYTWEQFDVATTNDRGAMGSSVKGSGGYTADSSTTAPLFRSFQSTTNTIRTFPQLSHILGSGNAPSLNSGEALPQVARNMKFRFTVRDNRSGGGGVDSDEVVVTVVNSGPFLITSQNTHTSWIYNGTNTAIITWSVNGTNTPPLNISNVKITLSLDGGNTFPITLLASTPNDGSQTINIPNHPTLQGRIKIEPVGNSSFFDINNVNISILNTCSPESSTISPSGTITANEGQSSLDLGLIPIGTSISTISGTLNSSSTAGNLSFESATGVCQGPSNSNVHNAHTFVVSTAGTYTFSYSTSTFGTVMNLYSGTYNKSSVCSNWVKSSGKSTSGSVNLGNSLSASLSPGVYVLVVSSFNMSLPSLPSTYSINYSGGTLYNILPSVGSPYTYTYVITTNTNGNIIAFSNNPDLRNSTTFPADSYTVYGLSYLGGDMSAYVGISFTSFQSLLLAGTVCGKLSSNHKNVIIQGNCPPVLNLSGAATSGKKQASVSLTSTQTISPGQAVDYVSSGYILLSPESGNGFEAKSGSVFKAEIKNCI
jgi:hypothetical protein